MGISQFPGVGPTNTDVANAVVTAGTSAGFAATGPTTTQIAAAVPTLAQITTAITSNAASAGVTMAAITSTVQANAGSPFGGTWTYLGYVNPNGSNAATFTGLSSYKYLKMTWIGLATSGGADLLLRINGDSANNYAWWGLYSAANTNAYGLGDANYPWFDAGSISSTSALLNNGTVEFPQSNNSTAVKFVKYDVTNFNGTQIHRKVEGIWNNTAAISSVSLFLSGGTFSVSTGNTRGVYMWGGN